VSSYSELAVEEIMDGAGENPFGLVRRVTAARSPISKGVLGDSTLYLTDFLNIYRLYALANCILALQIATIRRLESI
jgi:hypothetical protein